MATTNWSDLNRDGRRLEAIIKQMNTKYWKLVDTKPELAFTYFDRILKATHEKVAISNIVLGVKQLLKGEIVEYDKSLYTR